MAESQDTASDDEDRLLAALSSPIEDYLTSKGKGADGKTGAYRRNAQRELYRFARYLSAAGITQYDAIDERTLRAYIRDELLTSDVAPSTIRKYFDYVSAFIGWAQREGLVSEHYANRDAAREPLPETDTRSDEHQQTWFQEQRIQFLRFLDRRADEALDADSRTAFAPLRDRMLVYLVAYTGVRSREILADSDDDRRRGAEWQDLSEDRSGLTVLGKNQTWETRSVPDQTHHSIEMWHDRLEPAADWPLFPTLHRPTLYGALPEDVDTSGFDGIDELFGAFRDHEIRPPSLSTSGGRRLVTRLSEEADVDVDGEPLKLHGARRGVGRVLAMEEGAQAAADQLGNSVKVVEKRYSEVLAHEQADKTARAFEQRDGAENADSGEGR